MQKRKIAICATVLAFAICLTALAPVISAGAAGSAPVADNLELTTFRNISVGGRLSAVDPDGDTVTFEITTDPAKGSVELTEDGRFVYTPDTNRRGRDYFGYKAIDSEGNASQEATVIVKITKQKSAVNYSDLAGSADAYSATVLAEEGIFIGERLGSAWYFNADRQVGRGEFLAMCMELCDSKLLSGVAATGFIDDGLIPVWQKPYIATALMDGVISGYSVTGGAVFEPESSITCSEASVMLNSAMGLTDVSALRWDDAAPIWAVQATANLSACGVLPDGCAYDAVLTRADAANILAAAIAVINAD